MARKRKYVQKIPVERVIYDNYNLYNNYPDETIIEILKEDGYEKEEITESMIFDKRDTLNDEDWELAKECLKEFFLDYTGKWIMSGNLGLWCGKYHAGIVFDTFDDFFYKAIKDCAYWKFWDENGHLYFQCSHHDGTNWFEIKQMTECGEKYLDNWEYGSWDDERTERDIHDRIMKVYSRLPRFAEKVYGCKRYEYKPTLKEAV